MGHRGNAWCASGKWKEGKGRWERGIRRGEEKEMMGGGVSKEKRDVPEGPKVRTSEFELEMVRTLEFKVELTSENSRRSPDITPPLACDDPAHGMRQSPRPGFGVELRGGLHRSQPGGLEHGHPLRLPSCFLLGHSLPT